MSTRPLAAPDPPDLCDPVRVAERLEALARVPDNGDALLTVAASLRELASAAETQRRSYALVAAVSTRLLNLPMDRLDGGLEAALGELGSHSGVQRAYLFLLSGDGSCLADAYEWVAEGVARHDFQAFRGVPVTAFPWSMRQFAAGETVVVTDPDALPEVAEPERGACRALDIAAYVNMPLQLEGAVLGWLGFDAVGGPRTWSAEELRMIRIAADVFVNALQRIRRDELGFQARELHHRLMSTGTLAAGIAHEINNPLTYLVGNLGFVREALPRHGGHLSPAVTRDLRDAIDDALNGAERVRRIVHDLSVLAHGEDVEVRPVDLGEVLGATLRMMANLIRHRATLEISLDGLPLVLGAPSQLGQLFLNLLQNAVDALPEGRADQHRITVGARVERDAVVIEITDTGRGIPPEDLSRIFEPFFTRRPVGEGMGMGLALCHRIATASGGTIEAESTPGHGTVLRTRLRRAEAEAEEASARTRILVVDDEQGTRDMLRRVLRAHDVATASSGRQAIEALDAGDFDVILCDVMMPDLTGLDVHRHLLLRGDGREGRVVFITGGTFSADMRDRLARLPNRTLLKPFEYGALIETIASTAHAT